jgi:TniQ
MSSTDARLLVRVPPEPGELLSSWMSRLALLNGYKPTTLYRIITGLGWQPSHDLDCRVRDAHGQLAAVTGQSTKAVESCSMARLYVGNPSPLKNNKMHITGHLNLRFCPSCLRESGYFRLLWRIREVTVCPLHNLMLMDACPRCGAGVSTCRLTPQQASRITVCYACGLDLSSFSTMPVENENISWLSYAVATAMETEEVELESGSTISCTDLFEAIEIFVCWARKHAFPDSLIRIMGLNRDQARQSFRARAPRARTPLSAEAALHVMSGWLLKEWPANFKTALDLMATGKFKGFPPRFAQRIHHSSAGFVKEAFAEWSVKNRCQQRIKISRDQIDAAVEVLLERRVRPSILAVAEHLGVSYGTIRLRRAHCKRIKRVGDESGITNITILPDEVERACRTIDASGQRITNAAVAKVLGCSEAPLRKRDDLRDIVHRHSNGGRRFTGEMIDRAVSELQKQGGTFTVNRVAERIGTNFNTLKGRQDLMNRILPHVRKRLSPQEVARAVERLRATETKITIRAVAEALGVNRNSLKSKKWAMAIMRPHLSHKRTRGGGV